jgi:hypothetical protein
MMALPQAARVARRRGWPAGLAWALWALVMLGIAAATWLDRLLRQAGRADLALWTADAAGEVLATVSAATVGAVLAGRRPRHPVGWLLLGLALSVVAAAVARGYAGYGLLARPGSLAAADWAAMYDEHGGFAMAACLGFILLLTPTGSLPSPRWRWWAWATAAATVVAMVAWAPQPFEVYRSVANPLATPAADRLLGVANLALAVSVMAVPVGAWSLVLRFRRARGVERQRLRWLALAAALVAAGAMVITVLLVAGVEAPVGWVFGVCLALLPVATGAAILRYRSTIWTGSSAAPWPTGCSRSCSAWATPPWSLASAGCCPGAPAWSLPAPPWPGPRCSSRPAAASSRPWTAASTGAATTPPAPSPPSATGCASRSTSTP